MSEDNADRVNVDRFILDRIDSVPHLEALLLVWRERPRSWSARSLAERLWVKPDVAKNILQDLVRDRLVTSTADSDEYRYYPEPEMDHLLNSVNEIYRREMIRISTMIHSNASSAVRDFARAFRLKKEQD